MSTKKAISTSFVAIFILIITQIIAQSIATRSIDDIFKNAQRAFNTWSKWEPCDRTTENLLKMLDFDFFEVLDSVTIVEHISYDTIEGEYDSTIFTAEKNTQSFDKAFLAKKAIQDYVFTDGSAEQSIERRFAEDLDAAEEVCVYAKLPRTFQIPTPVGNYSPDWAIAFYEGTVKHIFFVAETKGTMETLNLRPIEQAKISCAKKLFNEMSNSKVVYHDVDSYQSLLNIMNSI